MVNPMNELIDDDALEDNRQQHIDYILKVNKVIGIKNTAKIVDEIRNLNYEEVIALSAEAEKVYKSHIENLKLDKLIKETIKIGAEAVVKKYSLERIGPNE